MPLANSNSSCARFPNTFLLTKIATYISRQSALGRWLLDGLCNVHVCSHPPGRSKYYSQYTSQCVLFILNIVSMLISKTVRYDCRLLVFVLICPFVVFVVFVCPWQKGRSFLFVENLYSILFVTCTHSRTRLAMYNITRYKPGNIWFTNPVRVLYA